MSRKKIKKLLTFFFVWTSKFLFYMLKSPTKKYIKKNEKIGGQVELKYL